MEDLINDSIIESISENYQIYKVTLDDNIEIVIKYAILETLDDWKTHALVRHNDMTFYPNKEDAEQALCEIVHQRFEEAAQ
jgi:hypothetical protein